MLLNYQRNNLFSRFVSADQYSFSESPRGVFSDTLRDSKYGPRYGRIKWKEGKRGNIIELKEKKRYYKIKIKTKKKMREKVESTSATRSIKSRKDSILLTPAFHGDKEWEREREKWTNEKRLLASFLAKNEFINFSSIICGWTYRAQQRAINKEGKRIE